VYEREKIMKVHHLKNDWSGRGSEKNKKKKEKSIKTVFG
jgi:multisubunit Na+/H+ antiporter MnhE subunit